MTLVAVHARAQALELARHPSFVVPTLAFPALFFLCFVAPDPRARAGDALASYLGFAVLGVAFFQFGVGIAADRMSPWESYLRTLPVRPGARFAARILAAALFASLSALVVVAVAVPIAGPRLPASGWALLAVALLAGSVPFALLGIAIGYWSSPRGALPVANLLYLGLSYAGGLWTGPTRLPHAVARVSRALPTRRYGELLWAAASGRLDLAASGTLALFALGFGVLAAWGYRRDEGIRYR